MPYPQKKNEKEKKKPEGLNMVHHIYTYHIDTFLVYNSQINKGIIQKKRERQITVKPILEINHIHSKKNEKKGENKNKNKRSH